MRITVYCYGCNEELTLDTTSAHPQYALADELNMHRWGARLDDRGEPRPACPTCSQQSNQSKARAS